MEKSNKATVKKIIWLLFIAVLAWLSVIALVADRTIAVADADSFYMSLNGTNVLTVVLFCFFCYIYNKILKKTTRRINVLAVIGAVVFALCELVGFNVITFNAYGGVPANGYQTLFNLIIFLGLVSVMYCALAAIFSYLMKEKQQMQMKEHKFLGANRKSFFLLIGLFFACWFVYFLANYPGLVSWDSYWQLEQGYGTTPYTNHHPIVHTLILTGVVKLGQMIFGTISAGIAFFIVIQMLLLASLYSFVLFYMAKRNVKFLIRVVTMIFFAAYPLFGEYSVTTWKDNWVSACILLYVIYLIEICINRENFFKSKACLISLFFVLCGMFFFKNNGIYIFFISLPFLIIVARKYWKKIVPVCLAAIMLFFVVTGPVYKAAGVEPGETGEALSVPLQQIARIATENDAQLTQQEKDMINEILPYNELHLRYEPKISDRVKDAFSSQQFDTDKMKYVKMWFDLVTKYHSTALLATLAGSAGYWYPETVYWIISWYPYDEFYDIVQRQLDELQIFDPMYGQYPEFDMVPAFDKSNMEQFLNTQIRQVPVLSMLFSIGFFYWIAFVCALALILKKRYSLLLPFIVMFGLWLASLASPVYAELRYSWAVFECIPLLIAVTVQDKLKLTRYICKREIENADAANMIDPAKSKL